MRTEWEPLSRLSMMKADKVVTLGRCIVEGRLFKNKKYLKIFEFRRETNRV